MDIQGISAIVTGAGSGMGEATARMLSDAGAKLALLDRNEDAVSAVASQIGALAITCDVADAASEFVSLVSSPSAPSDAFARSLLASLTGLYSSAYWYTRSRPRTVLKIY